VFPATASLDLCVFFTFLSFCALQKTPRGKHVTPVITDRAHNFLIHSSPSGKYRFVDKPAQPPVVSTLTIFLLHYSSSSCNTPDQCLCAGVGPIKSSTSGQVLLHQRTALQCSAKVSAERKLIDVIRAVLWQVCFTWLLHCYLTNMEPGTQQIVDDKKRNFMNNAHGVSDICMQKWVFLILILASKLFYFRSPNATFQVSIFCLNIWFKTL
jgi:hypothetical protein